MLPTPISPYYSDEALNNLEAGRDYVHSGLLTLSPPGRLNPGPYSPKGKHFKDTGMSQRVISRPIWLASSPLKGKVGQCPGLHRPNS